MKFKVGDFVKFPKGENYVGVIIESYAPKTMWKDYQMRYRVKETIRGITSIMWLDEDQLEIVESLEKLKEFLG